MWQNIERAKVNTFARFSIEKRRDYDAEYGHNC